VRHFFFFLLGLLVACTSKPKSELYLHILTVNGDSRKDTVAKVNTEYFEMTLSSRTMQNGDRDYMAHKVLERPEDFEGFRLKEAYLVSENDSSMWFDSHDSFLNYISERGYDMVDQKPEGKYSIDYTFKKKQ
jgi:hypothetical protein